MLSFFLPCLPPFTFLSCHLKLHSIVNRIPVSLTFLLNVFLFSAVKRALVSSGLSASLLSSSRAPALCSAPQAGSWESVSRLLSKTVAWLPLHASYIEFPLALKLTSYPCAASGMSTCLSVSALATGVWKQTHDPKFCHLSAWVTPVSKRMTPSEPLLL